MLSSYTSFRQQSWCHLDIWCYYGVLTSQFYIRKLNFSLFSRITRTSHMSVDRPTYWNDLLFFFLHDVKKLKLLIFLFKKDYVLNCNWNVDFHIFSSWKKDHKSACFIIENSYLYFSIASSTERNFWNRKKEEEMQ